MTMVMDISTFEQPRPANPMRIGGSPARRAAADPAERRRGFRVAQVRPVRVFDAITGKCADGQTRNVSTTGLQVELPAGSVVRPGQVLGVSVGVMRIGGPLANRRQMIPARVVWVHRPTAGTAVVIAGVEFSTNIGAERDAA